MGRELRIDGFSCREFAPGLHQVVYTLHQGARVTRRSSVCRDGRDGWRVVSHQGTVVAGQSAALASSTS